RRSGAAESGGARRSLVHAVLAHEVVDLLVGVDRLARVSPEPLDDLVLHRALLDVPVVHVRDLELATGGWRERRDVLEHSRVVEVEAGDGVLARRILGLLDDAHDLVTVELRDAEVAQVVGILLPREHYSPPAFLAPEVLDRRLDRALEDVVG